MERRTFIKFLLGATIGSQIPFNVPNKNFPLWNPHPKQLKFLSQLDIPIQLYGIPYHQSNGSTGEWLGISRA